ncbi:glycosyl transferase, family 4, conserved region [Alicyclobacillus hesperidum URH17-3-68]|uniref:UDP-GlcNAc:undecaprenyl-phosphate GlcNAc-1-phosphate transferase n=2 Tax=Alicyclobacillus hesperidum TaxID=89784 RepID=A0A1H2VAP2_9BACL|nr:MraY family glycosyltransferase [Alicyclobacillus hesperidum]EJY57247.1 glycosyl transferase, family 4, conserved region [Alicyclobacillus hesperidum URH17-3-68]SDW65406.1 UDP-GlcNAc:undecaprenyl-phosphate GlcNAc-1-phosphate transferase [Alicyclobacillus hesperidum]
MGGRIADMVPGWYLFVCCAVAALISNFSIPFIRTFALRTGFVDRPNQRKIHREPIPLLGGLAIYISFVVAAGVLGHRHSTYWGITAGGFIIFGIGVLDDYYKTRGRDFKAWPKFLMQIAAAIVLVLFHVRISGVNLPFGHMYYAFPGWLSAVATVFWVVAVTNMMNFLDGVDGLAAGIAAISALTLVFIALMKGQDMMAMLAISLVGSALGFLKYNFHPARIFMGDAGATFLGYALSAIAVDGAFKSATIVSLAVPMLALGVPILDTLWVVSRRFKERRPIYIADKGHTFHLLMKSGLNQVQTVAILYLVGVCFSLASILVEIVSH